MNASRLSILILVLACFARSAFANEPKEMRPAIDSLEQGIAILEANDPNAIPSLRDAAAQIQAAIDEHGYHSVAGYHALGNAYALTDDLGYAMLAYRRAQQIDPRDPRVRDSIEYVRDQVQVSVEPSVTNRVRAALVSWRGLVPRAWLWYSSVGFFISAWVLFTVGLQPRRTRGLRNLGIASLVLAAVPASVLGYEWAYEHARDTVILVHDQVRAMSGPDDAIYDQVFDQPLSAGIEAALIETRDGWGEVRLIDGSTCWVPLESIVPVVPRQRSLSNQ